MKIKLAKIKDIRIVTKIFSNISEKKEVDVERLVKKRRVYVLKKKGKIIGAFSYTMISILGICAFMYVNKLAVLPNLQGQGLGTILLSRIKYLAVKMGVVAFFLFSVEKAVNFYKKNKLRGLGRLFWWRSEA